MIAGDVVFLWTLDSDLEETEEMEEEASQYLARLALGFYLDLEGGRS